MVLASLVLVGCARERVPDLFGPTDAYVAYVASLARMGLDDTEMGAAWIAAGENALESPETVSIPYEGSGFIDPEQPGARGLSFALERRGGVVVSAQLQGVPETRAFLDVFRMSEEGPVPVASSPLETLEVRFFARSPGTYAVRFQPELLRGGEYALTILRIPRTEVDPPEPTEN